MHWVGALANTMGSNPTFITMSKENLNKLVSNEKTDTVQRNKERIRNREMLRHSQKIALMVLNKLDDLDWTKETLAKEMNVSIEEVKKIVSGKENLTLKTLLLLESILDLYILNINLYK